MKQIKHKQADCVGCDACAELAPQYFKMDGDGKARLRQITRQAQGFDYGHAFEDDLEALKAASESCSVQIIWVD